LTGQPELRNVLNNPDLRQLKQRVSLRCDISALPNVEETAQYIAHRLKVAGAERADMFSPGAIDYIFRCSEGIPRNINNLCADAQRQFKPSTPAVRRHANSDNVAYFVPKNGHEHPWETAPTIGAPAAIDSASTAHTAEATGGPALPGGPASRDAGATLGAVSSTRAAEFQSQDISAARVEPHLVAITSPRSPECEQFRSLRTRLLQASERERKRAFVVTSAGIGEGKTLTTLN